MYVFLVSERGGRKYPTRATARRELTVFLLQFFSFDALRMWSELAFLLHPREHTLVTLAFQQFAREEGNYSAEVELVWRRLEEGIETMPLE